MLLLASASVPAESAVTRDIIVALSAVAASVVAFLGLNAWRRKLKGTTEYRMALKSLRAVYALRQAVADARSRLTFPPEWKVPLSQTNGPEESRVIEEAQAYRERMARVSEARSELLLVQQEALAVWGERAKECLRDIFEAIDDMFVTRDLYFEEEIIRARKKDREGKETERDVANLVMRRVLYSNLGKDGNDAFGERIDRAVAKAEEFYRRGLK